MKKAILLCAVFALVLAGCNVEKRNVNSTAEAGAESVYASAPGGEAQKAETHSHASIPSAPVELKVAPEDRNQAFNIEAVETDEAFFYVWEKDTEDDTVNLIYFCPRGGTVFYPLCSKPNCRHNDSNCNAFCGTEIGFYNGSIYTTDFIMHEGLRVIKMNPDGTNHQIVATVDPSGGTGSMCFSCTFHHGKLFVFSEPVEWKMLDEQKYRLIVVNLEDGSQTDLATAYFDTIEACPYAFFYSKDKLYSEMYSLEEASTLTEIDSLTGETRSMAIEGTSSFYATSTTLYYYADDFSVYGEYAGSEANESKPGFREYDLTSGAIKDCGLPIEDIQNASYDEDYIYATSTYRNNGSDSTLYLLSRAYEPVDQIELTDGLGIAAVTSDRIYLYDFVHDTPISYYIDKTQIGSHNLTLIPIETVD